MIILVVLFFLLIIFILECHIKSNWTSERGKLFLVIFESTITVLSYFIIRNEMLKVYEFDGYREVGFIVVYILIFTLIYYTAKTLYKYFKIGR